MQRLQIAKDIKPLSEFRANASSFIQQVHDTKRPLVITHHGRSAAVVLDAQEYENLLETIELLQDVQAAEIEIRDGKGIDHARARKMVLEGF